MKAVLEFGPERPQTVPERFRTAPSTLFMDRFMNRFIKVGGLGVIAAVVGIFVFILSQIFPLFQGARVQPGQTVTLPPGEYHVLGADEWGELPFVVNENGEILFIDLKSGGALRTKVNPGAETGHPVTAFRYNAAQHTLACGTKDGFFFTVAIRYTPVYEGDIRRIEVSTEISEPFQLGGAYPVSDVAFGGSDERRLAAAIVQKEGASYLYAAVIEQEHSLFGSGESRVTAMHDLTSSVSGTLNMLRVNSSGDGLVAVNQTGQIFYFYLRGEEPELRQVFEPFGDLREKSVGSMDYLLGGVSLVLTNSAGENRIFSLFTPEGGTKRVFNQTKEFSPLPGAAGFFDASLRNKAFLTGRGTSVSLRYATTEDIRWEGRLPFPVVAGILGGKYDRMFLLDSRNQLHDYSLQDPHPEAGIKAFLGKIWYEGYSGPSYQWQSTGGSDDFEPKLSLVPLMIGTLKGTVYAMMLALPIALLAAVYVSQFAHRGFKFWIKPVMEIMASLPSVVLGFLAALWLAPVLETRVPSLLLILILLPLTVLGAGALWTSLSMRVRKWIRPGHEWIALFPIVTGACWMGWVLGPVLEHYLFRILDPHTGLHVADFRLWWTQVTGLPFEQRNSLVVGFMMGFAVIPIIFTISEDSLSNVPKSLSSGSLALGASRWQTAMRVVVPTAFPGIFSAVMIGLGRAIGETMIVVMATGNTPIMDFNIFSGMRTLSANIAVELPEAPYLGTLYRALFLGAMVLFLMTFVMNTVAEIIRQRIREKYRTV